MVTYFLGFPRKNVFIFLGPVGLVHVFLAADTVFALKNYSAELMMGFG